MYRCLISIMVCRCSLLFIFRRQWMRQREKPEKDHSGRYILFSSPGPDSGICRCERQGKETDKRVSNEGTAQ